AVILSAVKSRISLTLAFAAALVTLGMPLSVSAATPMPRHVFSPYFYAWSDDTLTGLANQSGARYFTLAFLETLGPSSCTLAWNGDSHRTVGSGDYASDIANLRALGGDVTISLGGATADEDGREIGDSCKDVTKIAAAYEKAITTYNVSRLD